ncbi:hypothetical protein GF319_15465 [Candidatus Bathyarchaeota archaeon]|nr:hypothetical protein [Candidatus Bathyarchaeota archaeon]
MSKGLYLFIGLLIGAVIVLGFVVITDKDVITDPSLGGSTSDDWVVAQNLEANGGLITGGEKSYGEVGSTSLNASDICDYAVIDITPSGHGLNVEGYGASISFPDDETLQADCLSSAGDVKTVYVDNTSSNSSAYLDLVTTGLLFNYASTGYVSDFGGDTIVKATAFNLGTSLAWEFDVIPVSASFQLND